MAKIDIEWSKLGFEYIQTEYYVQSLFKNGKWGRIEKLKDPLIHFHIAATCLHYGQECFEGLKAFSQKDGSVKIFRPQANAERMQRSAESILMEKVPIDLFIEAVKEAIRSNRDYIPPYGTGSCLYIRPLLLGYSPHIGLKPAEEYLFLVLVTPVGPYYKRGIEPVKALVIEQYDRAAPRGLGNVKVGGNYAASLVSSKLAKQKGYPIVLYLDPLTHSYIDEFGTSNFIGITSNNEYITPDSPSILPSITNDSLQHIARDLGLKVIKEKVPYDSISNFAEIGACGTAAIITPIYSITRNDVTITICQKDTAPQILTKLYNQLLGIQYGDLPDRYNWMIPI
ncbi:MAG: branched-chain amino acid aminotransferase [bacterium]